MRDLTEKQKRIYEIIKRFIEENGYSPSVREIMKKAKLNSPATIQNYINVLKDKGYITNTENKSRTIRINFTNIKNNDII